MESYTITGMAHGTPLAIADNEDNYGATSKFMIDVGIASSWHIAQFFGVTRQALIRTAATQEAHDRPSPRAQHPRAEQDRRAARRPPPDRRAADVSSAITRALSAIGLIK